MLMTIKLVVELADVRILALGVLNKPRGSTTVNEKARTFLHPPGIDKNEAEQGPHRGVAGPEETSARLGQKPAAPRQLLGACEISPLRRPIVLIRWGKEKTSTKCIAR